MCEIERLYSFESYRMKRGECGHLVTRGHFDSGHVTKMAVTRAFDPPLLKTPRYTQTL